MSQHPTKCDIPMVLKEPRGEDWDTVFLGCLILTCHLIQEFCLKEQKGLEGATVSSGESSFLRIVSE